MTNKRRSKGGRAFVHDQMSARSITTPRTKLPSLEFTESRYMPGAGPIDRMGNVLRPARITPLKRVPAFLPLNYRCSRLTRSLRSIITSIRSAEKKVILNAWLPGSGRGIVQRDDRAERLVTGYRSVGSSADPLLDEIGSQQERAHLLEIIPVHGRVPP